MGFAATFFAMFDVPVFWWVEGRCAWLRVWLAGRDDGGREGGSLPVPVLLPWLLLLLLRARCLAASSAGA